MAQARAPRAQYDDPRKLRHEIGKVATLASDHSLTSVIVGMAGAEGDLLFPEVVDYVESALRMDDAIVRITRERSILCLTDVNAERASEIMQRVLGDFAERFSTTVEPKVTLSYFEVTPQSSRVSVKDVLPALFTPPAVSH